MKRKSIFLTFGLLVLSWIGCVENDLPYPTIVGQITEMEVAGMTSCRILGASNMVEIKVADTIDLRDLRVEKLVVTEGMKVYPDSAACLDIAHFACRNGYTDEFSESGEVPPEPLSGL